MPTISSFRSNPSLTPCTMFASSDRVSPWSARTLRWSELRSTVRTLDSILTETLSGTRCESCPLGPSTRTVLPSTAIFTPWGTGIGFLPIRDMWVVSYLPHVGEDFAAELLLAGLSVRHDAARGGEDGHPHPTEDVRHLVLGHVHAPSRL